MQKNARTPSIVLIGGTWKSGKTDFALYIAENLLKISHMGTNPVNSVATNIARAC